MIAGLKFGNPQETTMTQSLPKVRHAIAGLGRIGSLLEHDSLRQKPCTHAGAIAQNNESILAGGCDPRPDRRTAFRKDWNCPVFTGLEEMLTGLKPDILHICVPPEKHLEVLRKAVEFGVGFIVCEKPLADTLQNAEEILQLEKAAKTVILVNHERRYSDNYLEVKNKWIPAFGPILSISARLYFGRKRSVREMLWDDGTHLIDIIQFLTGHEIILQNLTGSPDKDRTVFIACTAGKIPVIIEAGTGRDHLVFEIGMSFESAAIRIGNGVFEVGESAASPYYEKFRSLRAVRSEEFYSTHDFSNMIRNAVHCFRTGDKSISTAEDAFSVIRFLSNLKR